MAALMSEGERAWVLEGVATGVRGDGRKAEDFRRIAIETGVIPQANGSAKVSLGDTQVLVGVKAELATPSPDAPDRGFLRFSVECPAVASPMYIGKRGQEAANELAQSLERALGAGKSGRGAAIDLSTLKIVSGKACWAVWVDCIVLSNSGSTIDACSIGVRAALMGTRMPKVSVADESSSEPEIEVDDEPGSAWPLDTANVPLVVSVHALGPRAVVDCTAVEEACASCAVEVCVDDGGRVVGVSQRGGSVPLQVLSEMRECGRAAGARLGRAVARFVATGKEVTA
ncbi:unnamed protein product [Pedinophyceae sp. YPF-701]|nr:unnamed protein product [Pedinophyceae sp. YPF-701]